MLAMIMQVLDTTIANVALPHMQASLGAAQDTITWVLTSYIVAAAIATPITGWLSDHFGRKRLFMICVVGFVVASALCGIAFSLEEIVALPHHAGRVRRGAGAAVAVGALDINPRERQGQAMAIWGAGIMVAPILGPTLGGWLTDNLNWRWVLLHQPAGRHRWRSPASTSSCPTRSARIRRFDFFGFAMLSLADRRAPVHARPRRAARLVLTRPRS